MSDLLYSVALIFYMQAIPIRLVAYSIAMNLLVFLYKYLKGEAW